MTDHSSKRFRLERYDTLMIILIAVFFLIHLIRNFFVAPYVDEALWWLATRHLAAGYFWHPPLFAFEMSFFIWTFGSSPWALKAVSLFFTTATLGMVYILARDIFRDKKWAFLTALVFACWPIANSWLTLGHHDSTLAFFTVMTTFLVWRAVNQKSNGYWYLAGISGGLLLLTKLQSLLLFLGILLFLAFSKENRYWLRRKEPYLAFVIVLVMFVPTFLWYMSHHFEPITYQLSNRPGFFQNGFSGYLKDTATYLAWEFAMFSPFVYLFSIFGLIASGYLGWKDKDTRFLFLFWLAAPIIVFFMLTGGQYYWPVPGHIIALIGGVGALSVLISRTSKRYIKEYALPTAVVLILLVPLAFSGFYCYFKATYSGLHNGWKELAQEIDQVGMDMPDKPYLISPYYHFPGQVAYFERDKLAGYSLAFRVYESSVFGDSDKYYPWVPLDQLVGKDMIFVDDEKNPDGYNTPLSYWQQKLPDYFERVDGPIILQQKKGGLMIHVFYIFKCYGFKGADPEMNHKGEIKDYIKDNG